MDEYSKAIEYFNNKEFLPAEEILINLLEQNDNDYDVANFLGIIQLYLCNYKKAISYFNRVVFIYDKHANAFYNLGICYEKTGNNNLAISNYEKAIEYNQNLVDAYLNLGRLLTTKGEFAEAEKLYKTAIKNNSKYPQLYNNLANLYFKLNKWQDAIRNYKSAIKLNTNNGNYYFNLGSCYAKNEEYNLAIENYEKTIQLKQDHIGAMNNLAIIQTKLNCNKKAIELYHKIISIDEDNAQAYFNLANTYHEEKNYDEALRYYEHAIKLDPNLKSVFVNIGRIFLQKGDTQTAEEFFLKAIDDEENRVIAFTNLGVGSLENLKIDEAISFFDIAIKSKSDLIEAHYNKAHALLLKGKYSEGWQEYEWRKKRKDFIKPNLSKPELKDQNIKNKRILVYAEQGLGDTIHFVRYLKLLKEKNCYLIFECDEKLAGLFENINWIDELIICQNSDEPEIEYDYQIALLSLPFYFNTEFKTIPSFEKYLVPDTKFEDKWKLIIGKNENLKIGIVWAGNPNNNRDKIRSIPLLNFLPLFAIKGVDFYSLQVGPAADQLSDIYYPIVRLDKHIKNFSDTAAIINRLDLIITVDTSVAHLAGALGKPVWNLLMYLPDWRWLLNRKETPWYPSMRLYRQQKKGDWNSVLNEINYDLQSLVNVNIGVGTNSKIKSMRNEKTITDNKNELPLYLGLSNGENFGWGICSKYLRKELTGKVKTVNLGEADITSQAKSLPGYLFNAITNNSLKGLYNLKGIRSYGYTFFENELTHSAAENAKQFDVILAGSSWCCQKLKEGKIKNTDVLIQGIDPNLFFPGGEKEDNNLFVIFSGGKFELRKGQDLVIKAFKILQQKYSDMILINAWYNLWSDVIASMQYSKYINFKMEGNNWQDKMESLFQANEIDSSKIFSLPLVPNGKMRELYLKSDVGLFPNRCEGGTNLVMMEYMACGKAVIASYNSGHKDILNESNSLQLKTMNDFRLFDDEKNLIADWSEPELDEIIEHIEYAYNNREEIEKIGKTAGEHLKRFTWSDTADNLLKIIYK